MQSIAYCKDSAFLFCLHEMSLNRSQCHPRLTLTRAVPSAQPSRYSGTVQLASDEILDSKSYHPTKNKTDATCGYSKGTF